MSNDLVPKGRMNGGKQYGLTPCWYCGHRDARDETHARGCPELPALTQDELLRLAQSVEAGWKADERERRRRGESQ